jgi:hypothetical protein
MTQAQVTDHFAEKDLGGDTTGPRDGSEGQTAMLRSIASLPRLPLALIASPDPHTPIALCAPHIDVNALRRLAASRSAFCLWDC